MTKPLMLSKKMAKQLITTFVSTKDSKEATRLWDTLVPYINEYPEIYLEQIQNAQKGWDEMTTRNAAKLKEERNHR